MTNLCGKRVKNFDTVYVQNQIENYTARGSIHLAKARIQKNRKYNVTTQHKDECGTGNIITTYMEALGEEGGC